MARQVMSPIDLRSQAERQGITRSQQTIQAIAGILETVGKAEQARRDKQTLTRITRAIASGASMPEAIMATMNQPTEFGGGARGILQKVGGAFQPSPGLMGQNLQQAMIGQAIQTDPLETEYKRAQIESTKALTRQREKDIADVGQRSLNRANALLRTVGFMLDELWYMEDGPEKEKHIKRIQEARDKAYNLIDKYGETSEAGSTSKVQLEKIDEEITKAGGKVSKPKKVGTITATYGDVTGQKGKDGKYRVDSYSAPKDKAEFDSTFIHISDPKEKQRYLDKYWRPEFGRHLK